MTVWTPLDLELNSNSLLVFSRNSTEELKSFSVAEQWRWSWSAIKLSKGFNCWFPPVESSPGSRPLSQWVCFRWPDMASKSPSPSDGQVGTKRRSRTQVHRKETDIKELTSSGHKALEEGRSQEAVRCFSDALQTALQVTAATEPRQVNAKTEVTEGASEVINVLERSKTHWSTKGIQG